MIMLPSWSRAWLLFVVLRKGEAYVTYLVFLQVLDRLGVDQ